MQAQIPPSPYPQYNTPLRLVADSALILSDIHAPYQNHAFANRCLELAHHWGVTNLILAGDAADWSIMSGWGADFKESAAKQNSEAMINALQTEKLTKKERDKFLRIIEQAGLVPDTSADGEIAQVRAVFRAFNQQFSRIDYVIGNHEYRPLKKWEKSMTPDFLIDLILPGQREKWNIAPYYFMELQSGGQEYLIEHPYGAGVREAEAIATKYQKHVIMGHSHQWRHSMDATGKYHAIQAGHCLDELRVPYAAVRHRGGGYAHNPGAVIVRGGYPWLLGQDTPWKMMQKMGE